MKKSTTVKELQKEYNPKKIIDAVEKSFQKHREQLISIIGHPDSPILNYHQNQQISFLEKNQDQNTIIDEVVESLKDAVYFMALNKKERTRITQRMRSFESAYVNAVLERINHFLEEPELLRPPSWSTSSQKRRQGGISGSINDLMQALRSNLEIEVQYWENVSRAGYLTGLQMSMGKFFVILRDLSMSQKDQITIVQSLFDSFHVDWDEGDRENIKMSLQKPALANYEKQRQELRQISSRPFSKTLTPEMILTLEELTYLYKKYLRRF